MTNLFAIPEDMVDEIVIERVDDGKRVKVKCQHCGMEGYVPGVTVAAVIQFCLMHQRHALAKPNAGWLSE